MARLISAVCFDLDGVLIDTMPLHAQAWQETLKPLGLRISRREIYEWEGESGAVTARRFLARMGPAPLPRQITALLRDKERRFSRLARQIHLDPHLRVALRQLSRRSMPLALVTGTSSREVHRILTPDVRSLFDVIVTGDRVRHGKPHPEPYRTAFRRLGIPPSQTAVIENAPYGIHAARSAQAGWIIALASSLPRRYLAAADTIVSSTLLLAQWLLDKISG